MKKIILSTLAVLAALPCFAASASAEQSFVLNGMDSEYYIMLNSEPENSESDVFLLGSLSAKYESNGNPASISAGNDTGGASYGAYQFSSYYGVPLEFAKWCKSSGEGVLTGQRLIDAHKLDGDTYGENFKSTWKAIAAEDAQGFLVLQHNYTKASYYDVMVSKLESQVNGFDIDDYTIAFKNVVWSRAVQQGANSDVIVKAFENLGGFKKQNEDVLIRAVYEQSSKVVDTPPYASSIAMERSSAVKYGIDPEIVTGKYLYYYSRNSSDIQVSVYRRLAVRELADALAMYEQYKPEAEKPTQPGAPEETTTGSGGLVPVIPTTTLPDETRTTLPAEIELPGDKPDETTTRVAETTTRAPETTTSPEETTTQPSEQPQKPEKSFFDYIVDFFTAIIDFFEALFSVLGI